MIRGLTKTFGQKVAVSDLDLTIEQGMLVGLIGPNGAGKTTSIRMLMSIIFPDRGSIEVLGRASAIESKDRIGYLPEERGVYKKMRAGAFLAYMARLKGVDGAGLDAKVKAWLERVGLGDCVRKKLEEMSKGMQQKVQFVASIIHEPDLIVLDEPFSGLDPVNSRLVRSLVDEQHRAGRTIIFSTHQMSQAEALCDRVVMIHNGRKVLDNTPAEIRSRFDPRAILLEPVDADGSHEALAAIAGVRDAIKERGHVIVHLDEGADATRMVAQVAAMTPCRRIEVVRPTLEDVFLEIVQRDADPSEAQRLRDLLAQPVGMGQSDTGGD